MMLNITQLLQDAIYCDNQVIDRRDLLMGPTSHLQEIIVRCEQSLAECYQPEINYSFTEQTRELSHEELLQRYVTAIHWFLLYSARKQWTHLVVMSDESYQRLVDSKVSQHLADSDKQYLTIQYFLLASYYTHRQEDFRHAWHLLLKYGLVDLKLLPEEIMTTHEKMVKSNLA